MASVRLTPRYVGPHPDKGVNCSLCVVLLGSNVGEPKPHPEDNPHWKQEQGLWWPGRFWALNGDTGEEVWRYDVPTWENICYRGSDARSWYFPDIGSNPPVLSNGALNASFTDGFIYCADAAKGALIDRFDMKCMSCGSPAVAPGLLTVATQYGLYIWRDEALEEECIASAAASSDPRRHAGFGPVGDPIGGWQDDQEEWLHHKISNVPVPQAVVDDHKKWIDKREELLASSLKDSLSWSDQRKLPAPPLVAGLSGEGTIWVVVGGSGGKGIVVRSGEGLKSSEVGRLETGAKIAKIEEVGERVHYQKLEADGPDYGWVSKGFKGNPLIQQI